MMSKLNASNGSKIKTAIQNFLLKLDNIPTMIDITTCAKFLSCFYSVFALMKKLKKH